MKSSLPLFLLSILCGCLVLTNPSRAQSSGLAAITGTVQTGPESPLVGASLLVLHLPTGIHKVITTNLRGHFAPNNLITGGPYFLQITQPGFRPQVINDLYLKAGQLATFTVSLMPHAVADNGHAPDGVPTQLLHNRKGANTYLSAKYGYNISQPNDHNSLPYHMVQMGANTPFFYLKASYSFGS